MPSIKTVVFITVMHTSYQQYINCADHPIQSTLMFLSHCLKKSGPCVGYQGISKQKNSENLPEQELKEKNHWLMFEQFVSKKIYTKPLLDATRKYDKYMKQCPSTLSETEMRNPYHAIIKHHLQDLQILADIDRARSPYLFTMKRIFIHNNACLYCKEDEFIETYEHASWIEAPHVDSINESLKIPHTIEAMCKKCNQQSWVWYSREIISYPTLLMVLTKPQHYFFTEQKKLHLSGGTYKIISTLGAANKPATSFVELYDRNIRYCQGQEANLSTFISEKADENVGENDCLWASLYKLQSAQELAQEKEEQGCCTIS